MTRIEHLILHCSATPEGRDLGADFIRQVHQGPADLPSGRVRYMGRDYANRAALPKEKIGGSPISLLRGRGWRQVGYSKIVLLSGEVVDLVEVDEDQWLEAGEVTNGASGFNRNSVHYCYIGGCVRNGNVPKDTRTAAQKEMLEQLVDEFLERYPWAKVLGHNQVAAKACPSFDVPTMLREMGVPEANIYKK